MATITKNLIIMSYLQVSCVVETARICFVVTASWQLILQIIQTIIDLSNYNLRLSNLAEKCFGSKIDKKRTRDLK